MKAVPINQAGHINLHSVKHPDVSGLTSGISYIGELTSSSPSASEYFGMQLDQKDGIIVVGSPAYNPTGTKIEGRAQAWTIYGTKRNWTLNMTAGGQLAGTGNDYFTGTLTFIEGEGILIHRGNMYFNRGQSTPSSGSDFVSVFDYGGTYIGQITHPDSLAGTSLFGNSIRAFGDRIYISDPSSLAGGGGGAVYMFDLQHNYLGKANGTEFGVSLGSNSRFGEVLGCWANDGLVCIGAPSQNTSGTFEGAAFLYDENLNPIGYELGTVQGKQFGTSAAIGCGRVAVSQPINYSLVHVYDYSFNKLFIIDGASASPAASTTNQFGYTLQIVDDVICIGSTNGIYFYDLNGTQLYWMDETTPTALSGSFSRFGSRFKIDDGSILIGDYTANTNQGRVFRYTWPAQARSITRAKYTNKPMKAL